MECVQSGQNAGNGTGYVGRRRWRLWKIFDGYVAYATHPWVEVMEVAETQIVPGVGTKVESLDSRYMKWANCM